MFEAKEKSGWCMRQCCPGNQRGFEMRIKHKGGSKKEFIHINRPYVCTCCCCNRPEMTLELTEGANVPLGRVVNPWMWCNLGMHILDINNNLKYKIFGECCQ